MSEDNFQTFRYPFEIYMWDKLWKVHTFQTLLSYFKRKEKKKKSWVFSKAGGGGWRTIFLLLGILPKIINGTNHERCIIFKGFYRTLNKTKKEKQSWVFPKARGGRQRTIFRLFKYPSKNYWWDKSWKVHTFQMVL